MLTVLYSHGMVFAALALFPHGRGGQIGLKVEQQRDVDELKDKVQH